MTGAVASLESGDISLHAALGISTDLLSAAGVRRVSDREARDVLSLNGKRGDYSGIEYPYIDPRTDYRVTSRIRRDRPPLKADGSPDGKYCAAYGDRRHLYFPPGCRDLLGDTATPAVIVESEKAALAITAAAGRVNRRVLAIACGGCWSWRGVVGKAEGPSGERVDEKGTLPDFDLVTWTDRPTIVLFDAQPNASVAAACQALARDLRARGADVRHGHLPDHDRRINGPDDLIAERGDTALWQVIDGATPEEFTRTKTGAIIAADLDNVRLALQKLRVTLRHDAFAQQTLVNGEPLEDVTVDRLWVRIDDTFGFRPSKETLRTVLTVGAHEDSVHPVRDYLDALTWDGTPRLDDWLVTYGGAEPSAYVRAVGALPLIAAVRRVRQPGCKFDELLVLESRQGTHKSSALRALCPNENWFSDDLPLGVDSKHVIERTAGKWIIEAAEMHGNRGRESEQLKAFLSRQVDGPVRLAYGRLPTTVPRQFVMVGTTNAMTGYLKDATGARRFWPVTVQGFDLPSLTGVRDQLWAEAAAREACGESTRLHTDLWTEAGQHQEQRRAADPWEDLLEPILAVEEDAVPSEAVWSALGVEACNRNNQHADRVSQIVQRHGFTQKRKVRLHGGKPTMCWLRCSERSKQRSEQ